jgi:hypothetical protein
VTVSADLAAVLAADKALAAKAQALPWVILTEDRDPRFLCIYGTETVEHVAAYLHRADAEFIAAARSSLPRYQDAVEKVLELHRPGERLDHSEFDCTCGFQFHRASWCTGCEEPTWWEREDDFKGERVCSTVAAVSSALLEAAEK